MIFNKKVIHLINIKREKANGLLSFYLYFYSDICQYYIKKTIVFL